MIIARNIVEKNKSEILRVVDYDYTYTQVLVDQETNKHMSIVWQIVHRDTIYVRL